MNHGIILLCFVSSTLLFTADQNSLVPINYKETLKDLSVKLLYFTNAIAEIKELAQHDTVWKVCLENSNSTGKIVKHLCNLYSLSAPIHVAIHFGTPGALAWCKERVQKHPYELSDLARLLELQSIAYQPNHTIVADVLNLGITLPPHFALSVFAGKGNFSLVKLLLDHKTDVNYQDSEGRTALMKAAESKCGDITALLLERNALVNIVDNTGATALMFACKECYFSIAYTLVAAHAGIRIQDNEGNTALSYVYRNNWKNKEKSQCIVDLITKKLKSIKFDNN
jgi:hypothetical protein